MLLIIRGVQSEVGVPNSFISPIFAHNLNWINNSKHFTKKKFDTEFNQVNFH